MNRILRIYVSKYIHRDNSLNYERNVIMKKLIFFDIDGTLVTDDDHYHIIPESTRDTLKRLQQSGHLCFINTGRALSEIEPFILDLSLDGFVCGCGTAIFYHKETLFHQTIPEDLGRKILQDLEDCRLEWLLEGTHDLYYSTNPYTTRIQVFLEEHRAAFPRSFHRTDLSHAGKLNYDKFCICTRPDSNLSHFMDRYSTELDFIDRGNGFYEVVPLGCTKASGIQFLMKYFDIPWKDTIAIGDSSNDLPMLEYAATSIAMGGSQQIVCDASDFVTDPILDDGLRNAFCHFNLI